MARKKKQTNEADNPQSPAKPQSAEPPKKGFFKLPAEIRNEIYHLALVSPNDIHFGLDERGRLVSSVQFSGNCPAKRVSLLSTCRQINEEATPILYGANTFRVRWEDCLSQFRGNTLSFVQNLKTWDAPTRLGHIQPLFVKLRKCILQQRMQLAKLAIHYQYAPVNSIIDDRPPAPLYFARKLAPIMRAMIKIKEDKSVDEAIDVVEFYVFSSSRFSQEQELKEEAAHYTTQVREELRKILRK